MIGGSYERMNGAGNGKSCRGEGGSSAAIYRDESLKDTVKP